MINQTQTQRAPFSESGVVHARFVAAREFWARSQNIEKARRVGVGAVVRAV